MGTTPGFFLVNKNMAVPAITTAGDRRAKGGVGLTRGGSVEYLL